MNKIFIISLIFFLINTHAANIKVTSNQDKKDIAQLAGDGECSLREAIHAANTDTKVDACSAGNGEDYIGFDQSIISITLDGEAFKISDSLHINNTVGNTVVLDADNKSRIFNHTKDSGRFILENLKLQKGNAPEDESGGAIYSQDKIELINTHFSDNSAACRNQNANCANGGAIYSDFEAIIRNSKFSRNTSDSNGGAIYSERRLLIYNSEFSHNTSNEKGGAIYCEHPFYVKNTVLNDNRASDAGGGMFIQSANSSKNEYLISNSIFKLNKSKKNGGGIYIASNQDKLFVRNSSFTHNSAKEIGGAVYSDNASIEFINNTFGENTAHKVGSIYLKYQSDKAMATLVHNTIVNNTSKGPIKEKYLPLSAAGLLATINTNLYLNSNIIALNKVNVIDPIPNNPYKKVNADCLNFGKLKYKQYNKNNLVSSKTHACGLAENKNLLAVDPKLSDLITDSARCRTKVNNNLAAEICTDYYDLSQGSPAIDNASSIYESELIEDQIGLLRYVDGNKDGLANPDIGAIEFGAVERNKKIILNQINVMDKISILFNGTLITSYGELVKPISSKTTLNYTVGKGELFNLSIQKYSHKQRCSFSNGKQSINIEADNTEDDVIVDLTCITKVGKQFSDSFE